MPFLSPPTARCKASFLEFIRESHAEGRHRDLDVTALDSHFDSFVQTQLKRRMHPRPGRVPEDIFWLLSDDGSTFIGRVSVRHTLNEELRYFGGHIGYEIRPSLRRRGYGTLICRLGLLEARRLGLPRVLLTCDKTNLGSRRIIEANGGVYEGESLINGAITLRFWIELSLVARHRWIELHRGYRDEPYVVSSPGVYIVPVDAQGNVLLIREPAIPDARQVLSLPGGAVNAGESAAESANRELQEEVGLRAGRLDFLAELTPLGRHSQWRIDAFLARDLTPGKLAGDEPYPIEVIPTPLAAVEALIARGDLKDALIIAALLLARGFLAREQQP